MMMSALAWIEQTRASLFMREDFYAYFVALIGHAWGMAMLVGAGMALCLRLLGLAGETPLAKWRMLYPVMRVGAVLAAVSGLALLAGYPAKALTNWVFALKFACLIGAALLSVWAMRGGMAGHRTARTRLLAALALALWVGGVTSGKLLLYTNRMLLTSDIQFEAR